MATIYSNRNDNTGTHTTVDPNVGSTWAGGLVPATTDQVYIVGRRTTINMTSFAKWTGTKTITVASTTNFAASGFFYTVTDQGQIVKVDYTGTTSTTFTGCTVNESDPFYTWNDSGWGSTIFNGAYVHNPAYIITITSGQTFECNELIIQEGGWLRIEGGGTLKVNQGILVRDGRLVGRDDGTIIVSRPATGSLNTIGYFNGENYYMSIIDIDGGELRTYGSLSANAAAGSGVLTVTGVTNGNFAVGDEIAVYNTEDHRRRNKGYVGYRDASVSTLDMDEGLDVVGVSGSTLYVALRNGPAGDVKTVTTAGAQKIVEVDPDSLYFKAGDKVVISNNVYTVDSVEDSEYLAYDYDFTNPSTSLNDFWVNDSTHVYSAGWNIESGIGLRNTTGAYRELIHKTCWRREVILEAEMSPLDGYSTGTRGTAAFGLCAAYDPSFRWGHRSYDSFKTDYLTIDDAGQDFLYYIRSMSNYNNNRPDRVTAVLNATRTAATYKVISRKAKTQVFFNGEEFTEEFRRDGHFKGLVGVYTNGNSQFRCKRFTIKYPTQRLYITTGDSISTGVRVFQTGTEINHYAGDTVVKIATVNTGNGNHRDLAFAYRGQYGNGIWPLVTQLNGANTTNSSLPYVHNHDTNVDYYYDLGNAQTAKSLTIDLISQQTFTHVSFMPRLVDYSLYYGMNGVTIYGSNDSTNWTTLYGPTNDTKKWYYASYNRLAYYPTGTVSYRYIKFETTGAQISPYTNRYVMIGVHDFTGGYKIDAANASDLNIGDTITILTDSGYTRGSHELEGYYAYVSNGTDPETFWHGGWMPECTITNKTGNTLTLDRPIFWGYLEGEDSVTIVKTNRRFKIRGSVSTVGGADSWRWPNVSMNAGSSAGRKYLFRNIRWDYVGSYRYALSSSYNRGIIIYTYDYWNSVLFDGNVHMFGPDGTTWAGIGNYACNCINRNNVVIGMYTGYYIYSTTSYTGNQYFNNKITQCINGLYTTNAKALAFNYNEIATCDSGILLFDNRVDRYVVPFFNQIRRNYIKGTANRGIGLNTETFGPRRLPRVQFDYNKVRATDDYSINGQAFNGWYHLGSNFMAEHTGSRMSRYRNEGHFTEGDTSSDLSWCHAQYDYGRFGYDIQHGVYNFIERNPERVEIYRIYNVNGDDWLSLLGMEIEVLANTAFQIVVQFDYRVPLINTLQDDGYLDSQVRVFSLQHGTLLTQAFGVVSSTGGTDWNTFTYTFNTFASQAGKAAVYMAKDYQNGYMDVRNGSAYVLTDTPQYINVIGNTFNFQRIFDQYAENRDMRPLTPSNGTTINIKRIKI